MAEIKYCDKYVMSFSFMKREGCKLKHDPKRKNFGQYAICSHCPNQRILNFENVKKVVIRFPEGDIKIFERKMNIDEKDSDARR